MRKHIAIIGAGPIGLEAALAAKARGYEVSIYERGDIADSVRQWGHVRMFSPFSMNASEAGIALLKKLGQRVPAPDAILTGAEYAAQYLTPLGQHLGVQTHTAVQAIARDGAGKRDHIGEPERGNTTFRLLIETQDGERHDTAGLIFDCSGTFLNPNPLGDGGIPALGEGSLRKAIRYGLGETADFSAHLGKRTLVVGGGHSASTAVVALAKLPRNGGNAGIIWISKKPGPTPCLRIADDPLPERDVLSAAANDLVASGTVSFHSDTTVLALRRNGSGIRATLRHADGSSSEIETDTIIAATGYRPNLTLVRDLHVQTCWATEGTYKLAASLLGETGADCLAVAGFGAETLVHPEPNYFTLGTKSYGRTPDFLIRTGREQIDSLLGSLRGP